MCCFLRLLRRWWWESSSFNRRQLHLQGSSSSTTITRKRTTSFFQIIYLPILLFFSYRTSSRFIAKEIDSLFYESITTDFVVGMSLTHMKSKSFAEFNVPIVRLFQSYFQSSVFFFYKIEAFSSILIKNPWKLSDLLK